MATFCDVLIAIGKGQAPCLHEDMYALGLRACIGRGKARRAGGVIEAQNLRHRDGARRGRRHAADRAAAKARAQRRAQLWLIKGQIALIEQARVGRVPANRRNHLARNRTGVQGKAAAAGDLRERVGQLGIFQAMADRPGRAVRVIEVASGGRIMFEVRLDGEQPVQSRTDLEALVGQPDRRLEERRPGQATVLRMSRLEHSQHTRRAD